MSKEIIDPNSIRANTPDWQEGYEQGLLAGTTRAIVLCRSLQRSETRDVKEKEILEDAMILIAEKIQLNNNE